LDEALMARDFRQLLIGAKGSSSMSEEAVGENTGNPFRTKEGWDEFNRRAKALVAAGNTTIGLIAQVQEWERLQLLNFDQEQEYNEVQRAQEIFAELHKRPQEGKGND
jgi:hypothetical protein